MLLIVPALAAAPTLIGQYNNTWADTDNGGSNIWTTLAATNKFWTIDNGNQLLIINTSTTTSAYDLNVTIESGTGLQSALGDSLYQLDTNKTYILGPFEQSRFKMANGTICVSLNATRAKAFVVGVP
jgi:hypothetical protein